MITGQQRLGIAATLIGLPALIAGYVLWRSLANPVNTIGDGIFFGCMAAIPVFVIALVAVAVMLRQRVIRATVNMPESGRDDLLFRAMRATGFAFESERGATITFKQAGLEGLLSQIRLLVTKTPDGFVVVGHPRFVERALRLLGGAVVNG